ncbi:hypothetical protein BDB00DRAFT_788398 [Zychaea mexicana]|uniref:uncharacterized protein n=1 Tax=Zychaea mexicana TaxID=64656 RepID=UPI0022FDD78C|nr:uncharacterized protein BDB00DRAFT_788398 [Zychaea mexicana]KAI9492915.1 hypothetical protein BDB00DRAFT_788398 [Zychaea mexicana]
METFKPIITQHNGIPQRVEWGFMLENTFFKTFEKHNQHIIERNYHEVSQRVGSNYVDITDKKLGSNARVYFGVEQIHLRMPGTRYYVQRRLTPLVSYSSPTGATAISAAAVHQKSHQAATWTSSPPQNPRPSTSSPASLMYARRSNGIRSRESSSATSVSSNNSVLMTTVASTTANTGGYMRNSSVRRSSRRYGKGKVNNSAATQYASRVQPSKSARTISNYPTPPATTTASPGALDDFDWDIVPRLAQKPSQDWSLSTSSSTPSPTSPPSSPGLANKEPMVASHQQAELPNMQPFAQPSQHYHHRQQPQIKAALGTANGYYQPTTATLTTMPSATTNSTINGNVSAPTMTTTATSQFPIPAVIDNNYSSLSLNSMSDYDVVSALSMMSMPVSSQDPVHQLHQVDFLPQQQMQQQQQQQTSMFLNQLPLGAVAATAEQVSNSYWPWPMVPTATTSMQQTFAAGTADLQSCNNTHNNAFHPLFADESQLTWYTNNQASSLGFNYQ